MITILIGIVLLLCWLLFSKVLEKFRFVLVFGFLGLLVLSGGLFKITGFSGDLVPIVEYRWKQKAARTASTSGVPYTNSLTHTPFPQFGGPSRNGTVNSPSISTNWSVAPPKLLWRIPMGEAWSGFAVVEGLAITQEQQEQQEWVSAYKLETGELVWKHMDDARYFTPLGGVGPRATPTISSNRVYAFGATGILNCLDLMSGRLLWSTNLSGGSVPEWGFSGSPLLHENRVIVAAGGAGRNLVALDALRGSSIWAAGNDQVGYSSPVLFNLSGQPQLVLFNWNGVDAFHPQNGTALWHHPWPATHPHVAVPVQVSTNELLVSSGYGYGSERLRVTRREDQFQVEQIWKLNSLKSKFAMILQHENHIYGLDDGIFVCIDPVTGERKWKDGRYGHGQMLLVGNLILLSSEKGELVLIEPDPSELREIVKLPVFNDKTWNPPALAYPYLIMRNHKEAVCFLLPSSTPPSVAFVN
ncbi:MAG: PQQ-binding-like beta-propeller repeat protein [Verrucomicrobiota bacterium]|nr:PQQ-binding-like beta-propeller repeat protein [Verrucomicrobiota bacterium]